MAPSDCSIVLSLDNAKLRCLDKHRHHRHELSSDELRAWEGVESLVEPGRLQTHE